MVKEWIFNQTDTGWLLDGFPRNIKQAESLNRILDSINSNIDAVLLINVNTELLIKRLLNRQTIEIFFDLNLAKRSCNKEQKVLKVPNTDVFKIAAPVLLQKGISRIVCAENLIAL